MESLSKLFEQMNIINLEPGSENWVFVTHIINPGTFFVMPKVYKKYLSNIETAGDSVDPATLQIGVNVIFKSKFLKKFVRGVVEYIHNDEIIKCNIQCIDYGLTEENIAIGDIYKTKLTLPPLAVQCKLASCQPIGDVWEEEATDAMRQLIDNEMVQMGVVQKTSECLIVELVNSCSHDIATMLALTGFSNLGYGHNTVSRISGPFPEVHYITYRNLNLDEVLHVRLQTGKFLDEFYVAEIADYKSYTERINDFSAFCRTNAKNMTIEELKVHKPIGVTLDRPSKFERGVIEEVLSDSKARVRLLEWGNIVEVHISAMRLLGGKFLDFSPVALYCKVEEKQSTDMKLQKLLYPGRDFFIEIKDLGEGFNTPNIVNLRVKPDK